MVRLWIRLMLTRATMPPESLGSWSYSHPAGVTPHTVGGCPALSTSQGGKVLVGRLLLKLWRAADGKSFSELSTWSAKNGWPAVETSCALACMAQARLLERVGLVPERRGSLLVPDTDGRHVSAVIIGYNSREWLPGCFDSLSVQTYPLHETIVVDNGSSDGTADWLEADNPAVRLVRLPPGGSFAGAVNAGIAAAEGDDYLIINPDVVLEASALAWMLKAAGEDPRCAAVAAKLRFMWAPAFLNGLGNFVGAAGYGTDSALGHLDLGQFDHWDELPSACFAAALVDGAAVRKVGPLDTGFPMYYEDSEWCYRARLLGYHIRAAPQAVVYHAFGGRVPSGSDSGLSPLKLQRVTYGRLRFASRLLSDDGKKRFLRRYRFEDGLRSILPAIGCKSELRRAYQLAEEDYHTALPEILRSRADLQARRLIDDDALFAPQRQTPPPLMRAGLPLLTMDVIRTHYAGWLLGAARDRFPEMATLPTQACLPNRAALPRAVHIARDEGAAALLHCLAKGLLWRMQTNV